MFGSVGGKHNKSVACMFSSGFNLSLFSQESIDTNINSSQDMYCSPPDDEQDIMETLERMNIQNIPRQDIQYVPYKQP